MRVEEVRRLFKGVMRKGDFKITKRGRNSLQLRGKITLLDPTFVLEELTHLKQAFRDIKLTTTWRGGVKGFGSVDLTAKYVHHSGGLRTLPRHFVELPYELSNSRSPHETEGKYYIVKNERLSHPHDNITVNLKVSANRTSATYVTDLDLVGLGKEGYVIGEVINGRTTDVHAALLQKSEVWEALRRIGIPIERIILYVIPRSILHFKLHRLSRVVELVKEKGLSGKLVLSDARHLSHEEYNL